MAIIVFDAFGTLITQRGIRKNAYERLALAGGETRLPFLTRNVGIETFAHELGIGYLIPVIERELSAELSTMTVFDDVPEALTRLRARRHRLAICSNLAQPYGSAVRTLLPSMEGYVFSFEIGHRKPEPEIYDAVCKTLLCRPKEILWIGDSQRADFEGPQAFGMQARLIRRPEGETLLDTLSGII